MSTIWLVQTLNTNKLVYNHQQLPQNMILEAPQRGITKVCSRMNYRINTKYKCNQNSTKISTISAKKLQQYTHKLVWFEGTPKSFKTCITTQLGA